MRKKQISEVIQWRVASTTHKRSARPYPINAVAVEQPDDVKPQQDAVSPLSEEEPLTEQDLTEINAVLTQAEQVLSRTAERLDRIHHTAVEIVAEMRAARGLRTTNPGAIADASRDAHAGL